MIMSLEHLILGFISMRPATGYEIKSEFEQQVGALAWGSLSYGNLYPKLKEMEQKGWLSSKEEEGGRNKKVYELTAEGWKELDVWLGNTPDYPVVKDELMLKLMVWGISRPHDHDSLIQHLRSREVKTRELFKIGKNFQDHFTWMDEYGVLALELGMVKLEAELEWIQSAIKKLEDSSLTPGVDKWNITPTQQQRRMSALESTEMEEKSNE
jgi:PadR family transcriptional regulator, regulatory protein AphA